MIYKELQFAELLIFICVCPSVLFGIIFFKGFYMSDFGGELLLFEFNIF